jgi:hypothetical protein
MISIPLFSPGNDTFPPAIQLALVGISVLAFGSRSDLRYVPTFRTYPQCPTLRTFLLYKCFFFGGLGAEVQIRPAAKKKSDFNLGDFSPESRDFFLAFAVIFPRDSDFFPLRLRSFSPAILENNPRNFTYFPPTK